jgi:RNA polymerase sigma factor (sigma-70 family)
MELTLPIAEPDSQHSFTAAIQWAEPTIRRLARRHSVDADDALGDTSLRAWEERPASRVSDRTMRSHVMRIAHQVISAARRQRDFERRHVVSFDRLARLEDLASGDDAVGVERDVQAIFGDSAQFTSDPLDVMLALERRAALQRSVDALPERERLALADAVNEKPVRHTARRLGVRRRWARELRHQARTRLRDALAAN